MQIKKKGGVISNHVSSTEKPSYNIFFMSNSNSLKEQTSANLIHKMYTENPYNV